MAFPTQNTQPAEEQKNPRNISQNACFDEDQNENLGGIYLDTIQDQGESIPSLVPLRMINLQIWVITLDWRFQDSMIMLLGKCKQEDDVIILFDSLLWSYTMSSVKQNAITDCYVVQGSKTSRPNMS